MVDILEWVMLIIWEEFLRSRRLTGSRSCSRVVFSAFGAGVFACGRLNGRTSENDKNVKIMGS